MTPEQSAAALQNFFQAGQSLTQAYLDFVTKQQSAFSMPALGSMAPLAQLPMPSFEPFISLQRELATKHAQLWHSMIGSWQ